MKYFILTFCLSIFSFVEAQNYKLEGNELILPSPIIFETGSAVIKPESDVALNYIKNYLNEKTYISKIRIEAHVSAQANEKENQNLSEKRSVSVVNWLLINGIDCHRLIPVGFGSNKPIADNKTIEGRAANNRISIYNVELRGKTIGGLPHDGGGVVATDPCARKN